MYLSLLQHLEIYVVNGFLILKKSSLVALKAECDLQNKCKDKEGILIGIGSLNCNKCFISIHNKCIHEMGWVKDTSHFCSHSCLTNENPNVDDGNDGDVDILTIKDSRCKFVFMYNDTFYDCFQSPNSAIFQLKPLLTHIIFSETNSNLQVTQILYLGKTVEDNDVIKKIFNTKIVHNIMIIIKNYIQSQRRNID